jgi:7 transmembrane helices usually fused to an inactive transglutaminase/Transglutaminase-like superfamily
MLATRIYWTLIALAAGVFGWRFFAQGSAAFQLSPAREYHLEQSITVGGAAGDFNVEVFIPAPGPRLQVEQESLTAGKLQLRVEDGEAGRKLIASGGRHDLPESIEYRATIRRRAVEFHLPDDLRWADLMSRDSLDSTQWIPTGHEEIRRALSGIVHAGDNSEIPTTRSGWHDWMAARGIGPIAFTELAFEYCLNQIQPATFSGSTDALTALRLSESSCGGKSRLMAALCRSVGIPARLLGGVIMGQGRKKRTSHVWVEVGLGDQWVPYDPLNDHRAFLPAHYLTLYVGDLPLIRYSRGLAFDYGFRAPVEQVPMSWTLTPDQRDKQRGVPLLERRHFTVILLAPFALLFTLFVRQVIGVEGIGVFFPVLLGFCVTQIGWGLSAALLGATLIFGVLTRLLLYKVNMLRVPRAGILITFILILLLALTMSLERFGLAMGRGALILPIAALAMAVERFTNEALDSGAVGAMKLLGETLILAVISASILMQPLFKLLTVSYPEVLLVVVAEMLIIGQYRGLRLRELWRFRALRKAAP